MAETCPLKASAQEYLHRLAALCTFQPHKGAQEIHIQKEKSRTACRIDDVDCLPLQVKGEDGRVRVDACVNAANVLAAWADVEEVTGDLAAATQLLISAVEGYQRSLEQEEDSAVGALACS